jgi:hypothetical protein
MPGRPAGDRVPKGRLDASTGRIELQDTSLAAVPLGLESGDFSPGVETPGYYQGSLRDRSTCQKASCAPIEWNIQYDGPLVAEC